MAAEFSTASFKADVLESDIPVLVDFWSHGCPPCKRLAPVIDELASENEGQAVVGKCNVGENMELAAEYGITAVPTILIFKGGESLSVYKAIKTSLNCRTSLKALLAAAVQLSRSTHLLLRAAAAVAEANLLRALVNA